MQKHIKKIFNLALVVLFLALAGAWDAGALAQTQTTTVTKAELESAADAKRALATIGSQDFKRLKDPKLRDAGTRALAALKKLAKNTSKAREAALVADFDRTMVALKLVLPPANFGGFDHCDKGYENCKAMCQETGFNCSWCSKANNLCYLVKLAMDQANQNDPKNDDL